MSPPAFLLSTNQSASELTSGVLEPGAGDVLALVATVAVALAVSFLCSVLEATVLSSRMVELTDRRSRGDRGAEILLELKKNRVDDAISAILILNTISHTGGAALGGVQAAMVFGDAWVGVFTGVMTLLILVLTEIIPKTLGAVYASQLVGFVGRTTRFLVWILGPLLFFTRYLTRLLSRGERKLISRGEVAALAALAAQQGALRDHESRLVENVLRFDSITVEDVMTPRTVTVMAPSDMTLGEFAEAERMMGFSRIPLTEGSQDKVSSYVLHREVLQKLARGSERSRPLKDLARPIWSVAATESVGSALRQLIGRREHLAIAADEFGGVAGLVTMEDLVETVLGVEILDESDEVADLRAVATELRDRRLARLQALPAEPSGDDDGLAAEDRSGGSAG